MSGTAKPRGFGSLGAVSGGLAAALGLVVICVTTYAQQPPASQPQITFTKHVAPIFQKSCQSCHRPGSVAPMSLLTYNDARP